MMKQNKNYGALTPDVQAQISMMAIVGALSGQLFFGVLGDEVRWKTRDSTVPLFHLFIIYLIASIRRSHIQSFIHSLSFLHTTQK